MGTPGAGGAFDDHGRAVPVGPRRLGLGEQLLRGSRGGRYPELEGLLLWLVRLVQLHHRRQAAGVAVDDGTLGQDLRPQLLEHARAPGPRRCGHGGPGLRRRPEMVPGPGRAAGRHRRGVHPGGGPDVPLQQPRRPIGAAAHRSGLRHHAGHRERPTALAHARRRAGGLRLPHQGISSRAGGARHQSCLPGGRGPDLASSPVAPTGGSRGHGGGRRLVGAGGHAHPRRRSSVYRRVAKRLVVERHLRIQRLRAPDGERGRQRHRGVWGRPAPTPGGPPAGCGCSAATLVPRSRGCCRRRWCCWSPVSCSPGGGHGGITSARR